jgi:molecular chaperone GrpE (heat shock protein)
MCGRTFIPRRETHHMYLRNRWLSAARSTDWFSITRHDDPEPKDPQPKDPDPEPKDPEPEPKDPEDPDGQLGDAGKRALQKERAEKAAAKKAAAEEKKRADDLAAKVAEFEDRDKTELERATAKADAEAKRAEKAVARAVRAEVKALAGDFADVDDALVHLGARLSDYADDAGEVDTDAIEADLADLLDRKPHLRKAAKADPEPDPKKGPKPDPSQGPRKDPPPTDWRKADKDEFKKHVAEKYGARLP